MNFSRKLKAWLLANRTSVRLGFLLRTAAMGTGALLSLLWYRLLLRAMGDAAFGLFQVFQDATRLGGLGDLGITGAVGIKTGMMLGRGEHEHLRGLLASARSLFLLIAGGIFLAFALCSPWLPQWLKFPALPGAGSLPFLFIWAGFMGAVSVVGGYFESLNYAHGTVTWPILPTVLVAQVLAPLAHWRLALLQAPLWVQNLPYIGALLLLSWFAWRMLRWSHPWLGQLRPIGFDFTWWKVLAGASGWAYLCSLGSAIYMRTDRLVVNAGFGSEIVPTYTANYKACELATFLILSASFLGLPKLTQWMSSPHAADRQRAVFEAKRLNAFQIVIGIAAALTYLALNDTFIRLWLRPEYQGPWSWQVAFACNLAVTTGGDAGIQIASRCGENGLKKAGLAIGGTGLLNLALSLIAMRLGSIVGIAVATVLAQSVLSLSLGSVTCRHLHLSLARWVARSWLLPVATVLAAGWIKSRLPETNGWMILALTASYVGLLFLAASLAGLNRELLHSEWARLRAMLKLR